MRQAERPLFYTGGGVINSGPEASYSLRERSQPGLPITSTLMGLGVVPPDPQWLGMLGMHGVYEATCRCTIET